jgi:hypothetical protein
MRILLTGYFGVGNSGDEATLRGSLNLIEEIYPRAELYLMPLTVCKEGSLTATVRRDFKVVWYDQLPDIDTCVNTNCGIMGGMLINTIVACLDNNIPVLSFGFKTNMVKGSKFCDVYRHLVPEFKIALERLFYNVVGWQECGFSNVMYASDPAVFVEPEDVDTEEYIVCTPRSSDSPLEVPQKEQFDFFTRLFEEHREKKFALASFNESDVDFNRDIACGYPNVTCIDHPPEYPEKLMGVIQKAKLVISAGRFHALVYAMNASVPAIYVTQPIDIIPRVWYKGADPYRGVIFSEENGIPIHYLGDKFNLGDERFSQNRRQYYESFQKRKAKTKELILGVMKRQTTASNPQGGLR